MHLHLGCQLVIILVVVLSSCKAKSCKECDWESLIFQLPHKYDRFGRRCSSFSDFFCLHGYWYREKQSNRTKKTKSSDLERFRDLVKFNDTWKAFNWFSFRGAPFYSQVRQYWKHGWKYGVSPEEYLSRVTDFSAKGKILNSIKVRISSLRLRTRQEHHFGTRVWQGTSTNNTNRTPQKCIILPNSQPNKRTTWEQIEKTVCVSKRIH
ncbi:uncharacterized protein LOC142336936 isoform X2 [Convolutriloba macropyga]|uniref:uncharacterized protein LOC142336936 isoform X2 n=1 Tax=Convolutriloba macropyga TaxID=536237 RepID=UPI003F524343